MCQQKCCKKILKFKCVGRNLNAGQIAHIPLPISICSMNCANMAVLVQMIEYHIGNGVYAVWPMFESCLIHSNLNQSFQNVFSTAK